jgi:N-acetylmuramoyl-L-alanine amidase
VKDLEVIEKENNFKYFSGRYLKMKDAVAGQNFWRANGFKDAFVVAFLNGEKISTAKAIEISGE